jgi:hypothetical protein
VGLATAQSNTGVSVQSVVTNVTNGTITIHLNKAPTRSTVVGWSVADN